MGIVEKIVKLYLTECGECQRRDITRAKVYWHDYQESKEAKDF